MVDFVREKNYVNNDAIIIKTDEGQFEVSLEENNFIYIGFCVPREHELGNQKTFVITKENEDLCEIVGELFESINAISKRYETSLNERLVRTMKRDNPYRKGKITWYSDDFGIDEASKLIISRNEEQGSYEFTFIRSNSETEMNTYFVSIWNNCRSRYAEYSEAFRKFYENLLEYSKNKDNVGFQRLRQK